MLRMIFEALLLAYLPGALMLRLPGRSRAYRAALPADERLFWSLLLSTVWTVMLVLLLGSVGRYAYERLLVINGVGSLILIALLRARLRFDSTRGRWPYSAVVPAAIIAVGAWLYYPPAEYIIGGKDPGSYINEGIQIAQGGRVIIRDRVISEVPEEFRDLFFPSHQQTSYYGLRFMGFFIQDPDAGSVIGQFAHFYPASVAVAYGFDGLSGARYVIGAWAILALLAVYFTGARLFGRAAAAAAALLLAINVVMVWFARYPNSELPMQALLFAALLAASRARHGGSAFFGVVAGALLGLTLFLRYEILLAMVAFAGAAVLVPVSRERLGAAFTVALALTSAAGLWYLFEPMRAYSAYPLGFIRDRGGWLLVSGGVLAAMVVHRTLRIERVGRIVRTWLPILMAVSFATLAIYAYFFRDVAGRTALGDAMAFRTFGWYLTPWVLAFAMTGAVWITGRRFWRDPTFFLTFATFTVFFFYKTRIVPEHFWTSRRFLVVALPGALLLMAALLREILDPALVARLSGWRPMRDGAPSRPPRWAGLVAGLVFIGATGSIGYAFWQNSAPVSRHIEYAGLIPQIEQLASRIGDRDLVIVEARNAGSDLHVLAMPLAYIYSRNVLVLDSAVPPKRELENFVAWARTRYEDVLFVGGGGTDLLTRRLSAAPLGATRFQIPEYDTPTNAYPTGVHQKEFEFGLYRIVPVQTTATGPIDLSIGALDDLNVVRFHAREQRPDTGMVFRWTRAVSYVLLAGLAPDAREVTVWMSSGGRPPQAPPGVVEVALGDQVLGTVAPRDAAEPYRFVLPPALVERLAATGDPVQLRLRVPTWNPGVLLGVNDTRDLGVILTRVTVR